MILHDVAVTPDNKRMLCVGTLTASQDGLQPKKSRAEKQIIGQCLISLRRVLLHSFSPSDSVQPGEVRDRKVSYMIVALRSARSHVCASRVPVLHEVRDITMARTGDVALVSYENKVRTISIPWSVCAD